MLTQPNSKTGELQARLSEIQQKQQREEEEKKQAEERL